MTALILDSGGVTALAGQRARLIELRRRGVWPAELPAAVLVEVLTGDHRRDFHVNRLLRTCLIRDVDDLLAREAAQLRTASGRARTISAVDALVVALAARRTGALVLASDLRDLSALAAQTATTVRIAAT